MRFLLTNDDGYFAPGLAALAEVAARLVGEAGEVYVVAPETEQSYMGHRVTTGSPLRATAYAPRAWHVNGTPADCVRVALRVLDLKVDWVLSGINRGGNLGVDVYTSGTVAAAREAAILGVPAVAFSQYVKAGMALDWKLSQALARLAFEQILSGGSAPETYWNVNLPHVEQASVVECPLDPSPQDVRFELEGEAIRYAGRYAERPARAGHDVALCFAGAITVTKLAV
ncbi:MAG: 5'/3'-nucleotidase SurE [Bryobacter sp.]|nr:5'/3'-nucleotidase SurE [Bryobacter sp.]